MKVTAIQSFEIKIKCKPLKPRKLSKLKVDFLETNVPVTTAISYIVAL